MEKDNKSNVLSDNTIKDQNELELVLHKLIKPSDFYNSLLETSLTGFIIFKPIFNPQNGNIIDLSYVYLNPPAQRMLQLPVQPDKSFLTLYPHAEPTGIFAFYRDTFLSGKAGRLDINYQHDGLDNYFHLSAKPSGSILVVSFNDTADQKRTEVEQALRESQIRERAALAEVDIQRKQIESVLMQAPAMICIFEGPNHIFKLVNEPYQKLVGDRPILGLPIAEAMPELKGQPIFDLLDNVYKTGETFYGMEMKVQLDHNNNGQLGDNFYNLIYQALRDINGVVYGILVFAYEVTSQVLSRKVLEEEQQHVQRLNEDLENHVLERTMKLQLVQVEAERQRSRLERFFMQAPAAICILDGSELVYELVNPSYQQLFPGRILLGKPLLEALPEVAEQEVHKALRRVYDTGQTHVDESFLVAAARYEGGPLENFYFNFIFQARHNEEGVTDGVMVFAFDVTQQVNARQQAEQSQQKAQQLAKDLVEVNEALGTVNTKLLHTNKDLDNFIYTASHDLKAPMSNIEGLIQTLRDALQANHQVNEDTVFLLELIDKSIERFKSTIIDLTEISKVQKYLEEDKNEVDLNQIIEDVKLGIQYKISESQAHIDTNFAGGHILHFSRKNLMSIMYNLLSNAIKYRDKDKATKIFITTERTPEYTVLIVQDNGLGISESNISKMFSMFKRFHDHVEGTGIGLYIVKRIVDNAGGKIEVDSEVGKGTTFKVYFKH